MTDRLWALKDIAEYSGYGLTMAKWLVAQPDFPRAIRAMPGSKPRWIEREVRDWFEARKAAA